MSSTPQEGTYRIFTLHPVTNSKLYLKQNSGPDVEPHVIAVPSDRSQEQKVRHLPCRKILYHSAKSSDYCLPCPVEGHFIKGLRQARPLLGEEYLERLYSDRLGRRTKTSAA